MVLTLQILNQRVEFDSDGLASPAMGDGAHGAGHLRGHQLLVGQAHAQGDEAGLPAPVPRRGHALRAEASHYGHRDYTGHDRANHIRLWIR